MARAAKDVFVVAMSTVGSRVLGLTRDVLLFSMLGTGALTSAFLLAFTLPNLFRRLLGEGALTSAVIPVFTEEHEHRGEEGFQRILNQTMTRLGLTLFALILLGSLVLTLLGYVPGLKERWIMGADLSIVLLSYMFFICIAAAFSAALNVRRHFAIPALSQVGLNLSMILSLLVPVWAGVASTIDRIGWLCVGVLFGGLLQAWLPVLVLRRKGWESHLTMARSEALSRIWQLFLPGIWAAAIFQINVVVSRLLAFYVDDQAVSILYIANRLIELPLGVFAIAVSTVLFPKLALYATRKDFVGFGRDWAISARVVLAITIPAAVGLMVLGGPILQFLFAWGAFDLKDVQATLIPLGLFALALPFYSLSGLTTRAFHSLQDMKTPVRIAAANFGVNLVLSLLLMLPYGMNGLAAANAFSGIIYCLWLFFALSRKESFSLPREGNVRAVITLFASAVVMGAFCLVLVRVVALWALPVKLNASILVMAGIPLSIMVYGVALWMLRFKDFAMLAQVVRSLLRRGRKA